MDRPTTTPRCSTTASGSPASSSRSARPSTSSTTSGAGQGSVSDLLFTMGNLALVLQVVTITLILTRHRLAPVVAVAAGFPLAIGFAAAHWLPHWSAMSDPVWQIQSATWFSYLASTAEIVGALAVGICGLASSATAASSRSRRSRSAPHDPADQVRVGLDVGVVEQQRAGRLGRETPRCRRGGGATRDRPTGRRRAARRPRGPSSVSSTAITKLVP